MGDFRKWPGFLRIMVILGVGCLILGGVWNVQDWLRKAILSVSGGEAESRALPPAKGYIALIIDDFGGSGEGTQEMLDLGIPFTAAVMPFLPASVSDGELLHKAGQEVILHLPMEPWQGNPAWLGPRGITENLTDAEISQRVEEGLVQLPYAVGINNHMGSKATQDRRIMRAVLQVAKEQGLYYVDSKTSSPTVVREVAEELGVENYARDVFLDHVREPREIRKALAQLGEQALAQKYAVGIGHVGPEGGIVTAQAIAAMIPELRAKGLEFVFVSQLSGIKEN